MTRSRWFLLLALIALIGAYWFFDLGQWFSLQSLQQNQVRLRELQASHPVATALAFFLVYIAVTALSLPAAALLTLAAGFIFGLVWGTVIVSFASTIGATLAFLASRFLFREAIQQRFATGLKTLNQGFARDGAFYLLGLRLVPLFPFFLVNAVMGIVPIRTWTFYWVSQLGMLPGTVVYVNAGKQLASLSSLKGIVSPQILGAFVLLGIFPLLARWLLNALNRRRVYKGWRKPKRFDYNLVVIGAGSAGLVSSYIAATVRAKIALIEKHKMGGDCLNTGCVPSKAIIRSAKIASLMRRAPEFGLASVTPQIDFAKVMARVHDKIGQIEPHDSTERYTKLGVECIEGEARITSPWMVEVNGRKLTTRAIIIATGAEPLVPPIPGLDKVRYLTSETIWGLKTLPRRLAILGGGPIGCELAQCFARLGSKVTVIEQLPRLLAREDTEVSDFVRDILTRDGVQILTGYRATEFVKQGEQASVLCERDKETQTVDFDEVLIAVGRKPRLTGFGLEDLEIGQNERKTIDTNEFLQTKFPNIYACGDVAGPYQFTHVAAHQAWYASVNALFGHLRKYRADYSVIPTCTFTDPEVARVGLNEQEAREQGIAYEVTRFSLEELDRAIVESAAEGFIKVLTAPGKDRILGTTIAGEHAGELIAEFVLAMRRKLGLNAILGTVHAYPTLAEANKYVAGGWKKNHAPEWALEWIKRYHAWRLN